MKRTFRELKKKTVRSTLSKEVAEIMKFAATNDAELVYKALGCSKDGIPEEQTEARKEKYGVNVIRAKKKKSVWGRIAEAFINHFSGILFVLAVVSVFTDIVFAAPDEKNPATVIIIGAMLLISGVLRLIQDARSDNAAERLAKMVNTTATVKRAEGVKEIALEEIVAGDTVLLSAGDMIPADLRITACRDLFISQSALTGESAPVEKRAT